MRGILTGVAVVVSVAGVFLLRPAWLANLDDGVCDVLTELVSHGDPSGQVTIVEIDETSLAHIGRWPWPRDLLGQLVRRVLDRGAATVVLDTMMVEEDRGAPSARAAQRKDDFGNGANDDVLATTLKGTPVVAGYAFLFDGAATNPSKCALQPLPLVVSSPRESWGPGFFHPTGVLCSVPQISRAAASEGFLNAAPDSDGKLRRIPLVMEYGGKQYPSLALAAFNVYRRTSAMQLRLDEREASWLRIGTQEVPLEGPSVMRLRFRGPRRTFRYVSAAGVLSDSVPLELLRGKIALIGGSALGLQSSAVTPVDPLFPDVEVQATAIDNLLQGDSFHRPAGFHAWELLLALVVGLAATILLVLVGSWWSVLIVLGIAAATWAGCVLLLSRTGILLSPLPVTATLACNLPAVALLKYMLEKRRAEGMELQLASEQEYTREVQRVSESRYQRLVENINDAIIVDDAEGRLLFANRRFREWFGLQGRDIGEVNFEDCIAPEWRAAVRAQHSRRMSGEHLADHQEYEGIRADGKRIWIEALVTNVEENGRIIGTQSALRDITERKQIEAQYLQAQKMESIGRLAGGIAHDFNNMLTVINGYCDRLLGERLEYSEYQSDLKEIRAAGERATELTGNLLTFSRKQLAQPKVLDLNVLVAEAENMFGQLIGEDVTLISRLSPSLGQVLSDSNQLHQILMNLLVNARDAMPRGGIVVIETKNVEADEDFVRQHPEFEPGSYVYLGVTDNGTGMSAHVKRHLFEPFFTTKEPGKGTGLGLATIYGIVLQNAGRIEVTSKLDEGTTFHIYLPRVSGERPAPGVPNGAVAVTKGSGTILVVEDQDAVRRFVRGVLIDSGYCVLQAANGPDALALAEQFAGTIDLLVTDLVLPFMNGRELAEKLKAVRPGMRVLFTSGYAAETMGSFGIIADDLVYLPKPFHPQKLSAKVREALENPEASSADA